MTLVARFEGVLLLIAAAVALQLAARRLRVPPAAALILGGAALALSPGTPDLALDPDFTLVLFLPPLLLGSAFMTNWRDFRADLRIILQLAVGAVLFTTLVVGWVTHWLLPQLPWAACFALGAIVSPPDAVAAKAVLQGLPLPRRVVTLLEGESLVNDASGLVIYRFAVAAALTGTFDRGAAVVSFGLLAVGGVAAGVGFGLVGIRLIARLKDIELSVIASLLVAWASYIGAEAMHVSGVLSTVACGIVVGWHQHSRFTAQQRIQTNAVWRVVTFVLESLVFILIGLSLRGVMHRVAGDPQALWTFLPQAAVIIATVIVARFAWIFPGIYLPRAMLPWLRKRDPYPPIGVAVVMSWAGMRGVVSLAAALALPDGFPGRDFLLATTFSVILVTVLLQGSTLAPLIKAFRLSDAVTRPSSVLSEAEARVRVAAAELAAVQQLSAQPDGTQLHPILIEQYTYKVGAVTRLDAASGALDGSRAEHFATVLAAVAAGRVALLKMHRAREIHDTVLQALEHELDLDEIGARRFDDDRV